MKQEMSKIKKNMYDLSPCPHCQGEYRWPTEKGIAICDDCGHEELVPEDHYARLQDSGGN